MNRREYDPASDLIDSLSRMRDERDHYKMLYEMAKEQLDEMLEATVLSNQRLGGMLTMVLEQVMSVEEP